MSIGEDPGNDAAVECMRRPNGITFVQMSICHGLLSFENTEMIIQALTCPKTASVELKTCTHFAL